MDLSLVLSDGGGGGVNQEGDVEREEKTHHLCLWNYRENKI